MLLSFESWRCCEQQPGKRVLERELFEDVLGGALFAAGGLLERGQLQLVEEHLAELRARVDVECPARQAERLGLDRRDPVGELARRAGCSRSTSTVIPAASIRARTAINGRSSSA